MSYPSPRQLPSPTLCFSLVISEQRRTRYSHIRYFVFMKCEDAIQKIIDEDLRQIHQISADVQKST